MTSCRPGGAVRTRERAPIRIVHLGLGAFHRAHQVWFTERADPDWGIASFTGRTARLSDELNAQDAVYTLVERSDRGDSMRLMESLVEARSGSDVARLAELVARPDVAVVTLTVTEAGYHAGAHGAPARLVAALDARRRAGAGAGRRAGAGPIAALAPARSPSCRATTCARTAGRCRPSWPS